MTKRLNLRFLLIIPLLVVLSFMPNRIAALPSYGFAYLRRDPSGPPLQLVTIAPQNTKQALEVKPFPLPIGWNHKRIATSPILNPKGDWIAAFLIAEDNSRLRLQLFNLVTDEVRAIFEGHVNVDGRYIAWSPDGKYLAGILRENGKDTDLWIYAVDDDRLSNLSNDGCEQHDLGWSADSRKVFTLKYSFGESKCNLRLDRFDVETGTNVDFVDLTSLPTPAGTCNPVVSPTGRFVGLTSNCGQFDLITPQYPNEIYVWDIQSATLRQLSHYANNMDGKEFYAHYSYQWLDATTLFVGADYHIVGEPLQRELSTYRVDTGEQTILSTTFGHHSILSPTMKSIALTRSISDPDEFITSANEVQVSSVSSDASGNLKLGSEGHLIKLGTVCGVEWSPDGSIVAYRWVDGTNCMISSYKVTFIDQGGVLVGEFSSESVAPASTVPIGWLPVTP